MWLRELYKRSMAPSATGRQAELRARPRRRLRLEQLEDRTVPSAGTAADTVLVKDINPGSDGSDLHGLTDLGGTLLFGVSDALWRSDGTATGTIRVKDVGPGPMTVAGNTAFFAAWDVTNGDELWKTDGTTAGTVLVKDISPGSNGSVPNDSHPHALTNVNGTLFFSAYDPAHGYELWKSDGSEIGTALVKDITPGGDWTSLDNLTNVNGMLYFAHGGDLWKSDGTAAGTVLVRSTSSGGPSFSASNLTNVNGTLFFTAYDGKNGQELWKSDGTAKGTVMIKDIYTGSAWNAGDVGKPFRVPNSSSPSNLMNLSGRLFFVADDGAHGRELWKSDGTSKGTVLVKDIQPGVGDLYRAPSDLTNVNGTLFFSGDDGTRGRELWRSDGTTAGTVMVKDINPGGGSLPANLTNINGTLYFAADDATTGAELWKTDGTAAGTVLVKDINAGSAGSNPESLILSGGHLYFSADDGVHGRELWDPPVYGSPNTLTVLNNLDKGAGSLRDAIAHAHDGDTIHFDSSLIGQTITLTSGALVVKNDVDIEGPGAGLLAVSGRDSSRVFDIGAGLSVTIAGLTITHGRAAGNWGGGGILNVGSTLHLVDDIFSNNRAIGSNADATSMGGGAVTNRNGGVLSVTACGFAGNQAVGRDGGLGEGGAIWNLATATITGSLFTGNRAIGGDGGRVTGGSTFIGEANGGAIFNQDGATLTVADSVFAGNEALAGSGGSGGDGASIYFVGVATGGGITNAHHASLVVTGCTFTDNRAVGGSNVTGGAAGQGGVGNAAGGGLANIFGSIAAVTGGVFDRNEAVGGSNNGAGSGTVTFSRGVGGAIANTFGAVLTISGCTVTANQATGGAAAAGNGGNGFGGGVFNDGRATLQIHNTTITDNQTSGGEVGAAGSAGQGIGGGVYFAPGGSVCLDAFTLSHVFYNWASTDFDNVFGDFMPCH